MIRRLPLFLALTSLACGRIGSQGGEEVPDAATLSSACVSGAECALGQHCESGTCMDGTVLLDAGFVCTQDSDCPPPQRCLRSKGECVAPDPPPDAGPSDAGAAPDCVPGEEVSCGVSKLGECRLGISRCEADSAGAFAFSACVGAIAPVPEVCDGLDNDCDGVTDEGLPDVSCGTGACARTVASCANGVTVTCAPGTPAPSSATASTTTATAPPTKSSCSSPAAWACACAASTPARRACRRRALRALPGWSRATASTTTATARSTMACLS